MIDTHSHIDAAEFESDLEDTLKRAADANINKILIPAIDYASSIRIIDICTNHSCTCYPMLGLHPEEVKSDVVDFCKKMETETVDLKNLNIKTTKESIIQRYKTIFGV